MKIKEIIEAVQKTKSHNSTLQFVTMDTCILVVPQIIKNNCVEIALNYQNIKSENGYCFAKIKLSDFIKHLKQNTNLNQKMFVNVNSDYDYFISGWCDLADKEGGHFEITPCYI